MRRGKGRVGYHGRPGSTGTTTQAGDILGEIMITASFGPTFPIAGAEGNHSSAPSPPMTHSVSTVMAHVVMGHHVRWPIPIIGVAHGIPSGDRGRGRKGAPKTCRATLKVGETARWTSPVSWARAIFTGREGGQYLGGAIEDTAGGRRDLDGLFVEGASVHTEAFGCLRAIVASV